jgi:hypothetical protein
MGLKEIGWIHLAQERNPRRTFVNTDMNVRVP